GAVPALRPITPARLEPIRFGAPFAEEGQDMQRPNWDGGLGPFEARLALLPLSEELDPEPPHEASKAAAANKQKLFILPPLLPRAIPLSFFADCKPARRARRGGPRPTAVRESSDAIPPARLERPPSL